MCVLYLTRPTPSAMQPFGVTVYFPFRTAKATNSGAYCFRGGWICLGVSWTGVSWGFVGFPVHETSGGAGVRPPRLSQPLLPLGAFLGQVGVAVLLIPMVPPWGFIYVMKEWAYAGFAINLVSAIIAHLSISDRPLAFVPSTLTSVLWAASYFFSRRLHRLRKNSVLY